MSVFDERTLCPCRSGKNFDDCHGNPALEAELESEPIRRQDLLSIHYRKNRYLEYLNESALLQRTKDVMENYLILKYISAGGIKVGLHTIDEQGWYWFTLFNDIMEECLLRGYSYPDPFRDKLDLQIPTPNWPGIEKAQKAFEERNLVTGKYLVKYGKEEFLRPMLEKGSVRIIPASSYNDTSLNQAIRDEELSNSIFILPTEATVETVDETTLQPQGVVPVISNIEASLEASSNYYVYCLSYSASLRLFPDFEADSCLIINKPRRFVETIVRNFQDKMSGWKASGNFVSYFDPLHTHLSDLHTGFSKHFRYAYQNEYRITWVPQSLPMKPDPVFLELGNLKEYCELITLSEEG